MGFRVFLDTADVKEISKAVKTGVVDGIATNPNKMAQVGRKYADVVADIRSFFNGPIAVEAISTKTDDIVEEAKRLSGMSENIVIKIPATQQGIAAVKQLVPQGIITNTTLILNPAQALMAGLAGSPFISPFIGRMEACGQDGLQLFHEVRQMYERFDLHSVVIAASIKNCHTAVKAIVAGADSIALTYPIFCQMFEHPMTDLGIDKFTSDYRAVNG